MIRKIGKVLREGDFKVTVTLLRPVREVGKTRIINIQSGDATSRNYAVAMDIGTTTVYGQLIDLLTGEVLSQHGEFNGQISYGEDVLSRIVFAEKPEGLDKLHEVVIGTINTIIRRIVAKAQVDPEAHRGLIVRVAGYSDYFCDLSPALQDEIIARTEHEGF